MNEIILTEAENGELALKQKKGETYEVCFTGTAKEMHGVATMIHAVTHNLAVKESQLASYRWIPVSERLPEMGKKVFLLYCKNPPFRQIYYGQWMEKQQQFWYASTETGIVEKDQVTHWMPILPLPEKGGE